jgi:hypothetical protein
MPVAFGPHLRDLVLMLDSLKLVSLFFVLVALEPDLIPNLLWNLWLDGRSLVLLDHHQVPLACLRHLLLQTHSVY